MTKKQTIGTAAKTAEKKGGIERRPDPRLVALVKYLARRAAERDYETLRAATGARSEGAKDGGRGK